MNVKNDNYITNEFVMKNEAIKIKRNGEFDRASSVLVPSNELNSHKNHTCLKRIQIFKLFGKYDYDINFEKDVNIWVSENGQGKTTILRLIVAVLSRDLETLGSIEFSKIVVTINGDDFKFEKSKNSDYTIRGTSSKNYIESRRLNEYLNRRILRDNSDDFFINSYIDMIEKEENYNLHIDRLLDSMNENSDMPESWNLKKENSINLKKIKKSLNETVYFYPTYRRIEISQDKVFREAIDDCDNIVLSVNNNYANFGMKDVKESIERLLDRMSVETINSYSEMNGSIINDLLSVSSVKKLAKDIKLIDEHKVKVVINRIGEERINNIDDLNEFVDRGYYQGNMPNADFLKFYLARLVSIYDKQMDIDDKLKTFTETCNKYLSPNKKIRYDEASLTIRIYNDDFDEIELEQLSSGEKQMVSIFAQVYLDINNLSIMVIDEPELSLSIEWQKDLLQDIYNSGKVGLLIVTTHSPFIYKNEFRRFTKDLNMLRRG